jgi:hypothetical protein
MALPGVNNPLTSSLATIGRPHGNGGGVRPTAGQPGGVQPGSRAACARRHRRPPRRAGLRTPSLTAPQPGCRPRRRGTDPELWQMLTGEERPTSPSGDGGPLTTAASRRASTPSRELRGGARRDWTCERDYAERGRALVPRLVRSLERAPARFAPSLERACRAEPAVAGLVSCWNERRQTGARTS